MLIRMKENAYDFKVGMLLNTEDPNARIPGRRRPLKDLWGDNGKGADGDGDYWVTVEGKQYCVGPSDNASPMFEVVDDVEKA